MDQTKHKVDDVEVIDDESYDKLSATEKKTYVRKLGQYVPKDRKHLRLPPVNGVERKLFF